MVRSRMGIPTDRHSAFVVRSALLLLAAIVLANAAPAYAFGFSPAAPLNIARIAHTATLLADGRVLVVGGSPPLGGTLIAAAEIYDPIANTWTIAASNHVARGAHTATLLPNGKVLVAGGQPGTPAELYDPLTDTWTNAASLVVPRRSHTATLLANGKVLVAGGYGGYGPPGWLVNAELYDPATDTWASTGSMKTSRQSHTATALSDGTVLVVGGYNNLVATSAVNAEIYDPATGGWTETPPTAGVRYDHTATMLANGNVLITGGSGTGGIGTNSTLASAEVYDPVANLWKVRASLANARLFHTATLLPNGYVLVVGGFGSVGNSAEIYDPANDTWSDAGTLATSRSRHTATLLANGKVLIASALYYDLGTELYDALSVGCRVQFSAPNYRANENAGQITVAVVRFGDCAASATVNYDTFAVGSGPASPGADFTSTTGTLSWNSGDTYAKAIAIPIIDDVLSESNETFAVRLSASGNGTSLGNPTLVTVTIVDDDSAAAGMLWNGAVVANPYGALTVQGATLTGNTISNLQSKVSIQLGTTPGSGNSYAQIDIQGFAIGSGNTLTIRGGAPGQVVILNNSDATATSIAGILQASGASPALVPVIHLHNANGISVNSGGNVAAMSGLIVDTLGGNWTSGQPLVNDGVIDGGTNLQLMSAKVTGGGIFKGNAFGVATFGNANNPANGRHFLANGLQIYPSNGSDVALVLNGYGASPQILNLMVNGNASVTMPSAWSVGASAPQNNLPVLPGGSRPAGTADPGYGGGSMIVQASGMLTLGGGTTNDFVFPGGIVLKSGIALDLNGVAVSNGFTTSGKAFQGVFFESAYITSTAGPIQVFTNDLNWVNFSSFPHAPVRARQLIRAGDGSAQYVPADLLAPHLNTYALLSETAAAGLCWLCALNPLPVDMQ